MIGPRTPSELTLIELDVLRGAARGETVPETAARRISSAETIKSHRKHILWKLEARNITEAVALAYERGLLGADRDEER